MLLLTAQVAELNIVVTLLLNIPLLTTVFQGAVTGRGIDFTNDAGTTEAKHSTAAALGANEVNCMWCCILILLQLISGVSYSVLKDG